MNLLDTLHFIGQILSPGGSVPEEVEVLPAQAWESIVAVSSRHMVTPALFPALVAKETSDDLEPALKQYLSYIHDLNVQRNTDIIRQAGEIGRALNDAGIIPVFLKGTGYLFSGLHGDPGGRVVGDIDLLVPEARAGRALGRLREMGYEFLYETGPEDHHHLPPVTREGVPAVVELHTRPLKRDFDALLSPDDLWRDMRRLETEDAAVGIPTPTYQAVICVEHEGLANRDDDFLRVSLRGIHDLACLIARGGVDWDDITGRFKRTGLEGTLKRYLRLTRAFFNVSPEGKPVPKRVPLFLRTALSYPKGRKSLVVVFLSMRLFTDRRIRNTALAYAGKVIRGEVPLASLKRQIADGE